MLNQEERRRFNEIAEHLNADRRFARQVNTPPPGANRAARWAAVLCAVLVVTIPSVMVLGGWPLGLPVVALFALTVAVAFVRRRGRSTS